MRLLRRQRLITRPWRHAPDDQVDLPPASTVSVARWLRERAVLRQGDAPIGLRIEPGQDLAELAGDLPRLALVAIEMGKFGDGRAFSTLRLLREQYRYPGEIRIRGEYLPDQIHDFLCAGADSFELPAGVDAEGAIAIVRQSDPYHPAPFSPAHRFALRGERLRVH